jgi:hypothetical protein
LHPPAHEPPPGRFRFSSHPAGEHNTPAIMLARRPVGAAVERASSLLCRHTAGIRWLTGRRERAPGCTNRVDRRLDLTAPAARYSFEECRQDAQCHLVFGQMP